LASFRFRVPHSRLHQSSSARHLYGMTTVTGRDLLPGVVESAAAGDEIAFARIVATYHDDMVRVSYLVAGDVDLAHEAVQSAWPIAWRKLRTLRDHDRLRPWLVSIAANEARQLIRRKHRRRVVEIAVEPWMEDASSSDPGSLDRDRNLDLVNAVGRLAADDRVIVAMRYALGFTSAEIGRATGRSAPGIRSRLQRALVQLKKDLGDD
jgi:RNA polymerase sigma factor (sigma-70 family)